MVFLKNYSDEVDLEKESADDKKHAKLPSMQRVENIDKNGGFVGESLDEGFCKLFSGPAIENQNHFF